MGRSPCCDKENVKKGPWSPEEDVKLKSYMEQHGTGGNWIALPQKIGLKRCGKSCRLRWLNYLRPNIKHGGFSDDEDRIIFNLYTSIGSRWSIIAAQLPGRTDNDIKNHWNTRLRKKLLSKQRSGAAATAATAKSESRKRAVDDLAVASACINFDQTEIYHHDLEVNQENNTHPFNFSCNQYGFSTELDEMFLNCSRVSIPKSELGFMSFVQEGEGNCSSSFSSGFFHD